MAIDRQTGYYRDGRATTSWAGGRNGGTGLDAYRGRVVFYKPKVSHAHSTETRWARISLFGVIVWLIPFLLSFALFWVMEEDPSYYFVTMTALCSAVVIICAMTHLRETYLDQRLEGLIIGAMWLVLKLAGDAAVVSMMNEDMRAWLLGSAWHDAYFPVLCAFIGLIYHLQGKRNLRYSLLTNSYSRSYYR